jgi:hypothetical protein
MNKSKTNDKRDMFLLARDLTESILNNPSLGVDVGYIGIGNCQ